MSSRSLRVRNMDPDKPLRLVRVNGPSAAGAGLGGDGGYDSSSRHSIRQSLKKKKNKKPIPIPRITTVRHAPIPRGQKTWKQPMHYIKFHLSTGAQMPHQNNFYDLRVSDVKWMNEQRAQPHPVNIPRDAFVRLMELFEKTVGRLAIRHAMKRKPRGDFQQRSTHSAPVDCKSIFSQKDAEALANKHNMFGNYVPLVYDYWISKRIRLGKALMRRYQEPPAHDDSSPNTAFRPRERERRVSHRNPRKNDPGAFNKMRYLKRDFENVLQILRFVRDREIMKRDQFLLDAQIFDEKLRLTPFGQLFSNMELNEKSADSDRAFCQFMKSRLPESNYAIDPSTRNAMWQQRRPARPIDPYIADLSSDDTESEFSDTASDVEFYEETERIMQNKKKPPDEFLPPEEADPFRYSDAPYVLKGFSGKGKARIGRLGRVIFDLAIVEESEDASTDADDEMDADVDMLPPQQMSSSSSSLHPAKKFKSAPHTPNGNVSLPIGGGQAQKAQNPLVLSTTAAVESMLAGDLAGSPPFISSSSNSMQGPVYGGGDSNVSQFLRSSPTLPPINSSSSNMNGTVVSNGTGVNGSNNILNSTSSSSAGQNGIHPMSLNPSTTAIAGINAATNNSMSLNGTSSMSIDINMRNGDSSQHGDISLPDLPAMDTSLAGMTAAATQALNTPPVNSSFVYSQTKKNDSQSLWY